MASLDIIIVVFALMIILILDIIAIGMNTSWTAGLALVGSVYFLGYFVLNFTTVGIGNLTTIPFELFIVSWIILPIFLSLYLIIRIKRF